MPIPDYQTLMLPVLKLAARGETRILDMASPVADEFGLTPEERVQRLLQRSELLLVNRMRWADFHLRKAGLVMSRRKGFSIATEAGRALLACNPDRIDVKRLMTIPAYAEFHKGNKVTPPLAPVDPLTPEEQIEAAYVTLQSALRDDVLQRILQTDDSVFFENLIVKLLIEMGYGGAHGNAVPQLRRSGDGGVDGLIIGDKLGLDRLYVQAKKYRLENAVGRPDLQAFVGSLVGLNATKGVFVATSKFSQLAIDFVKHLPQNVILIDGQRLANLMIEHNVGVRVSRRPIEFKHIDEDFFSGDD